MAQDPLRPRYNLYNCNERFLIVPIHPVLGPNLEIQRFGEFQINISTDPIPPGIAGKQIDGIVGIIQLVSCHYLIVISGSKWVGMLNMANIYRVIRTELIPFRTSDAHLSENERHANQIFVEMLETVLKCDAFYFSLEMDISHSLQWISENAPAIFNQQPLFHQTDPNFVWNARLCAVFNTAELSSFAIPLIHGFVGFCKCTVNDNRFNLALISRRSVKRAGVRFHTRGLDHEGNCANFVETEQIVEFEAGQSTDAAKHRRFLASFVQIRASVPLLWTQRTNLRWQPDPSPWPQHEQVAAYEAHLNALFNRYRRVALNVQPRIIIVNLINQYGREHILGEMFHSVVKSVKDANVHHERFDFHRHCSSLNWDRLVTLRNKLEPDVRTIGFFLTELQYQNGGVAANFIEHKHQDGLFRTNCMDCLDRTNVVQALLGMESLRLQLQSIGILPQAVANFDAWPRFVEAFKNLWADNGDDCSKQYAGTAALKTDYTRVGYRTVIGTFQDAWNSVVRYFKNNLTDGYRQDAINLFLGNYVVDRHNLPDRLDHSPFNFDQNFVAIGFLVLSFAMAVLCFFVSENSYIALGWLFFSVAMFAFIWMHGEDFSDHPRFGGPDN